MIITPKIASDVNLTTICKSMTSQNKPDNDADDETCVIKVIDNSGNNIQLLHLVSVRSDATAAAENRPTQARIKTSYIRKKIVKRKIMVGSGNKTVCSLIAGVTLIKKSMFHVGNLNESIIVEKFEIISLKSTVTFNNVLVLKHG